eukprot:Blabericola_migrator_1__8774@NODE_4622_length_1055_cov_69_994939_g2813_i1_p1_GENE_NODE_4622_length_1055_cov_69_994939_g2813_i1NODE_4622_length_1055_cov_69_994939_g2813_i1_p1_ORF_typecomplete_len125_score8_64_NODE_4622_length_1055_cov_69_994939_g2813_i1453827
MLKVLQVSLICTVNEAERLDMDRLKHPMTRILDLSRSGPLELPPGVSNLNPFSVFTYPRGITASGAVELKPLTQGRMGFALCFSLVDLRTLEEAMEIHYLLTLLKEKKRVNCQFSIVYVLDRIC